MSKKDSIRVPVPEAGPSRSKDPSPTRSEVKVEDFVKCELCRQMLQQPKTLQCMHSFCKACLKMYISETSEKDSNKDVVCPICLQATHQPKGAKTASEYVDAIPSNEFLTSYLEAVGLQNPKRKCDTCRRQNRSETARHWCRACHDALCDNCVSFHNALKATKKHNLQTLTELRGQPIQSIIVNPHCDIHDGETVTRYCQDHAEVICDKCVVSHHKNCKDVKTIREASAAAKAGFVKTKATLGDEAEFAKAVYDDRSKEDRTLDSDQATLLQKIQSVRKKIDENLAKCESQIIGELYEIHGKEKATLQSHIKEAQRVRKASSKIHGLCESTSTYGNDSHLLLNNPEATSQSEYYKGKLTALNSKMKHTQIEFIIDSTLEKLMTGIQRLGNIRMTSTPALLPTPQTLGVPKPDSDPEDESDIKKSRVSFKEDTVSMRSVKSVKSVTSLRSVRSMRSTKISIHPSLDESFSAQTATDTGSCWFTGIAFLQDGQFVLVDRNNNKLKCVSRRYKVSHELRLKNQPFGITATGPDQIAVTLPRENRIEIYKVGIATFSLMDTLSTSDRGYGICYAGDRFAVAFACASQPHVKLLTKQGTEKNYICPDGIYHPMFLRPWYVKMDPSGSTVFVSDCHTSLVTSISGTVVRKYFYKDDSLNSPRGLYITRDGRLLVCGFGSDNVQMLNASGQHIGDVLNRNNNIMGPQDVALNPGENKMVVTFDPSSGKSDTVNVYNVYL